MKTIILVSSLLLLVTAVRQSYDSDNSFISAV